MMEFLQWMETVPDVLHWLMIFLLACIPFIEGILAVPLSYLVGVNLFVAVPAAVIGNIASVLGFVMLSEKIASWLVKGNRMSKGREKFNERFNKYGVIGTALLGPILLPTQLVAVLMSSVTKTPRPKIILWMSVSVVMWVAIVLAFILVAQSVLA